MRKNVSKKLRFEIFKRDSFKCRYCGRSPVESEITLEIEHVVPVSKGGDNSAINLVSACNECNSGKSDRLLSDQHVMQQTLDELERLQERKNQIEQMVEWRRSLVADKKTLVKPLADYWNELAPGLQVGPSGLTKLVGWVTAYGADEVVESMTAAAERYLKFNERGHVTEESWQFAFSGIPKICAVRKADKSLPGLQRLYYCKGIIRNRFNPRPDLMFRVFVGLKQALEAGIGINEIENACKETESVSHLRDTIENEWLGGHQS